VYLKGPQLERLDRALMVQNRDQNRMECSLDARARAQHTKASGSSGVCKDIHATRRRRGEYVTLRHRLWL